MEMMKGGMRKKRKSESESIKNTTGYLCFFVGAITDSAQLPARYCFGVEPI